MIFSLFGTPLAGPFFVPLLVLGLLIYFVLRNKSENDEEEEEEEDNENELEMDRVNNLRKDVNESSETLIPKIIKKARSKKCCKDESKSDINSSIKEIKIYYGSNGKSKVYSTSFCNQVS